MRTADGTQEVLLYCLPLVLRVLCFHLVACLGISHGPTGKSPPETSMSWSFVALAMPLPLTLSSYIPKLKVLAMSKGFNNPCMVSWSFLGDNFVYGRLREDTHWSDRLVYTKCDSCLMVSCRLSA